MPQVRNRFPYSIIPGASPLITGPGIKPPGEDIGALPVQLLAPRVCRLLNIAYAAGDGRGATEATQLIASGESRYSEAEEAQALDRIIEDLERHGCPPQPIPGDPDAMPNDPHDSDLCTCGQPMQIRASGRRVCPECDL